MEYLQVRLEIDTHSDCKLWMERFLIGPTVASEIHTDSEVEIAFVA